MPKLYTAAKPPRTASQGRSLELQKKKEKKPKEIKLQWAKGLAQKRKAEIRLKEIEAEKDKPFALARDDPEFNRLLMEEVRWDDPIAAYLVKKKRLEPVLPDLGDSEKMKESGFIVPKKSQFTAGEEEGLMLHQTAIGSNQEDTGMEWIAVMDTRRSC